MAKDRWDFTFLEGEEHRRANLERECPFGDIAEEVRATMTVLCCHKGPCMTALTSAAVMARRSRSSTGPFTALACRKLCSTASTIRATATAPRFFGRRSSA